MGKKLKNDLTGMRFGRWLVIGLNEGIRNTNETYWDCICDCGTKKAVASSSLIRGRSKSCGCKNRHDLIGVRFGRLVPIEKISTLHTFSTGTHHKKVSYLCKCDCGNVKEVLYSSLVHGDTTSCGCFHNEKLSQIASTHKKSHTRLYKIWASMKSRCYNKNAKSYKNYGAIGIIVCDSWKNNFEKFENWANHSGYKDTLTLERKEINGNYCPENCNWITKSEQANNTSRNIFIEILGHKKNLKQWTNFMRWNYSKYEMRFLRGNPIFDENEKMLIEEKLRRDLNVMQTNL